MKNKSSLVLTLLTPFLLLSCSEKNTQASPLPTTIPSTNPSVLTPTTNRPSLGEPIHIPSSTPSIIQEEPIPNSRPVQQHSVAHGKSSLSKKMKLPNVIKETSGLIKIDNRLWTMNDSGGKPKLYQIDERNGRILKSIHIKNARNKDWEDIAYDDTYVYIGDFGNNRGNRKDLKIYKIPRAALNTQKSVRAEVIDFKYSDQKNFNFKAYKHNYDCEAMVAHNGKLYLFSKNWQNKKTRLYELSTTVGKQVAQYKSTFNTNGMVTGATLNKELGILLLSTYSSFATLDFLNVNVWSFTNYNGSDYFKGSAKKLNFKPLKAQIEGITFIDNYKAYLSSENFKKYIFSFDASLYELDFSGEFE